MKEFDTYVHIQQSITPIDNVYQLFVQINDGEWYFKGLISENAKNTLQSEDTILDMNEKYESQKVMATFTKQSIEKLNKKYMFIPCPNANVSIFKPSYKTYNEK